MMNSSRLVSAIY